MATAILPSAGDSSLDLERGEQYEVIGGQVVEKRPMGAYEGWIAGRVNRALGSFAVARGLGDAYTDMLFLIDAAADLRRKPDVAVVGTDRWPIDRPAPRVNAWNVVPNLAIEVISPTDIANSVMDRTMEYLRCGVQAVWLVFPSQSQVHIYESPTRVRILQIGDELDGGTIVPGFRMPLVELFAPETPAAS